MKYKSPAARAFPPPSVDGLLAATWYLSPKLLTEAILAEALLTLAIEPETVFTLLIDPATVLIFVALLTAAFILV